MTLVVFLLPIWLLPYASGCAGQVASPSGGTPEPARALAFGVPSERDIRSGEVHEHDLTVAAGALAAMTRSAILLPIVR